MWGLTGFGWGDADIYRVADLLASGIMTQLEELKLNCNRCGDEGAKAIAAAIATGGALATLRDVNMSGNRIGADGLEALICMAADADQMTSLDLRENVCRSWAELKSKPPTCDDERPLRIHL